MVLAPKKSVIAYGIPLLLVFAPLARASWDIWSQTLLHLGTLLLTLPILWSWGKNHALMMPHRKISVLLACVLTWAFFSAAGSTVIGLSVQELGNWLNYFVLAYLVFLTPSAHNVYLKTILLTALALVAAGLFKDTKNHLSFASFMLNPNILAGYLIMAIPLTVNCGKTLPKRDQKRFLAGAWITLGIGLFLTRSTAAGIGLALGILVVLLLSEKKNVRLLAYALGCLILLLAIQKIDDPWLMNRWRWWKAALSMACSYPWGGVGLGTFEANLSRFQDQGLSTAYAHSWFLQIAAEWGWPGLGLILVALVWMLVRIRQRVLLCAVLAALFHNIFDFGLVIPANALTFWCLMAIGMGESRSKITFSRASATFLSVCCLLCVALLAQCSLRLWAGSRHLEFGKYYTNQQQWVLAETEFIQSSEMNPLSDQSYGMLASLYLRRYTQEKLPSFLYQAFSTQIKALRWNRHAKFHQARLVEIRQAVDKLP